MIDDQAAIPNHVHSLLQPDEQIVWFGQPLPGFRILIQSVTAFVFIGGFALLGFLACERNSIASGVFSAYVALAFISYLVMIRSEKKTARKTVYVITNHRAIGAVPNWRGKLRVFIHQPEDTGNLKCRYRASGIGRLVWTERVPGVWSWFLSYADGFYELANVANVHKLLLATFVPLLIPMLNGTDPAKRRRAALSLANAGEEAVVAIPALTEALQHDDAVLRRRAATALGRLGTRAATSVNALRKLQFDEYPSVVKAARDALSKIGVSKPGTADTARPQSGVTA